MKNKYKKTATRSNDVEVFVPEEDQDHFIIAMDNYFTLPKVMKKLREKDIGVVGTACFRKNWPPKELKNINADEVDFNDFYWTIDENNTLVGRWIDNGLVLVVSTFHTYRIFLVQTSQRKST